MATDPWANRPKGRVCKTCIHFIEKTPVDTERNYTIVGRCRRHSPVVGEGYPIVFPNDWCGDYKLDENKL